MGDEKQSNQLQATGGAAMRDRARQAAASVQAGASEAARQGAEVVAEAGRIGAEALHLTRDTATEAASSAAAAGLDSGRRLLEAAAKQTEEFTRQMAETIQATTDEMRGLMPLPAVSGGLKDMQRAVAGLVDAVTRTNLRVTQEVLQLNGPGAAIDLQRRIAREYFDTLAESQVAILRAAHRTAEDALRPLEARSKARRHDGGQAQVPGAGAPAR